MSQPPPPLPPKCNTEMLVLSTNVNKRTLLPGLCGGGGRGRTNGKEEVGVGGDVGVEQSSALWNRPDRWSACVWWRHEPPPPGNTPNPSHQSLPPPPPLFLGKQVRVVYAVGVHSGRAVRQHHWLHTHTHSRYSLYERFVSWLLNVPATGNLRPGRPC